MSERAFGKELISKTADVLGMMIREADENIIVFGGIGRYQRITVYHIKEDTVWCGCFCGSLAQFEDQIRKQHKDAPHHLAEYLGAVEFLRAARAARLQYPQKPKTSINNVWATAPYFCVGGGGDCPAETPAPAVDDRD